MNIYGAYCNKNRQSEHWCYQRFQGSKFSNVIIKILLLKSSICYPLDIELPLYKIVNMKLIYIRSTMEPKNYSTIRSILKKEQGEKIAPYIFKINDTQTLEAYLRKEKITYEIYQEERKIINVRKRKQNEDILLPNKKQRSLKEEK